MSHDGDSLILRNITPDKLKRMPSKIRQVLTAEDGEEQEDEEEQEYEEEQEDEEDEGDEGEQGDEEDGDDIDHGDNNVGSGGNGHVSGGADERNNDGNMGTIKDGTIGTIATSGLSVGSISSVGLGSISTYTTISVSSSAQDSIMKRLLLNIAVDPEPMSDVQSTITSVDLPYIERPQNKRSRINPNHVPSQRFPDKSLPTELLDDFIAYTKEYKAKKRYEMGQYTDVTKIIMNYALKKHLLLKKFWI